MAKYTITHACGHESTAQLVGKLDDRDRRIEQLKGEVCDACRARDAREIGLIGSDKQVAWAADIRAAAIRDWRSRLDQRIASWTGKHDQAKVDELEQILTAKIDAVASTTDARWWIDNRDKVSYTDTVETPALKEHLANRS